MCICIHGRGHGIDDNGKCVHAENCLFLLLRLDDLLHNFGLLNQECAQDALLDAFTAPRTTVCPAHSLLALGDGGVFAWPEGGDARQTNTTVTAFRGGGDLFEVVVDELPTGGLDHPSAVRGGVVGLAFS